MKLNMVITAFGAVAITAAALAPQAHADETSYQAMLAYFGLPTGSTALELGRSICQDISAHGAQGIENQVRLGVSAGLQAGNSQDESEDTTATLIVAAVNELCPSNTHTLDAWINEPVSVA